MMSLLSPSSLRTLAVIINKCLSGKTTSNDRLRKSRIDILWVTIDVSEESDPEPVKRRNGNRSTRGVSSTDELLAADTMQAIKESKKINRRQPNSGGSSEGTGSIPGVPDESTIVFSPSSEGTGTKPGVLDEEKDIFEAKADTILDRGSEEESEYSDEENVNEEEDDCIYSDDDEDKKDDVDDDKSIDLENIDDDETDDEFVYSDEYANNNEDEEMNDADVAKLEKLEILRILQMLRLTLSSPFTYTITPILQQQSIPIPTPPITTEAPTFTTSVPEIPTITTAAFNSVQLRVADLEKDVTELKKVDHSTKILATIRSQVPAVVNEYLGSSLGDALHKYDLKHALFQSMNDSKSFIKHPTNQALYHALMEVLIMDEEAMDKGVADSLKQQKRPHGDKDEDPSAGPNQGKKTKRRRTKESDSSKNTSTTKETSKGKALTKGSKAGNSATAEETVEEPINELIMDDMDNIAAEEIDKLTKAHLVGPVYKLLKDTCKSNIKLEYNIEECFKELTDKLDWNNPEGDRCPFDLTKYLPLKGRLGHLTIVAEYFFNNDMEFLKSSYLKKNYTTSITKTKAVQYKIVGIKDMIPMIWSATKLFPLDGKDIVDFIIALCMITRSLIIKRRVEDLQLGIESYQKKLNITKPQKTFPGIEFKELYTPSFDPPGVIYEDLNKQKRVLRADELYKFSDGTLKTVRDELHHWLINF
ncbi:hypothetical protein Tco_1194343 [Tanacetum coccineum]